MTSPRPAHIAMFSIAAHGHVNPSLEVIRELVARGHRVTYAIPHAFVEKVAETGAEPRPYTTTLPSADADPEAWGTELIDNIEPFLTDAITVLPELAHAYEGDEPDLVLHDITSYPARVLARRWGVPEISLSPNLVAWEGYEEEVAEPMYAELKKTERGQAYYARFHAWLAENGITQHCDPFVGRPPRSLVLIPKALQPHADRVDESVHTFVGACQGDRAAQGEWERPAGAEKVLLVSLGSAFTKQPAFYRACVEAFGDLPGWHVVLQVGRHVDPAELGALPGNVEVHPWVPQLAILKQADAFITHAGAGGSQEGLATATPMVAVPQAVDQFGNADMLQALGVARHLPMEEATAATLREAVLALAGDPEVARRLGEIQRAMAAEGGTKRAADLIEAELRPR
ncbi:MULTISPECIES: macrolide-inactivating glycosyltransferase [Streptomyces]|uniref:Glycosyl transferase n=1 Tax=Streptomyces venezuelae TaxID=54571 RepID=A0A5P2BI81_STRVZ|nr:MULTISPECIES: macrolide-inactivating glycosyltransferase [Streptomyces]NEA05858.1 macrolide-inactivating glycosyltransferase [Streptomyces sp. SID10116]MYY85485.1 macrolide-inactivating glycosyltransferase [Streptomyces sp. SID335]MYZ17538.1 macrolide-inactivating glycosyltransferase [Streptomyces sp. SID337]NDZ89396.1 macrolide-inactivating glycosyltransferase [Streptomyces sp. SID10115]NEB44171.1 macrolide-inactivating glycosyltransferase [Streptomyces sp. SID339]